MIRHCTTTVGLLVLAGASCRTQHHIIIDPIEFRKIEVNVKVDLRVQNELNDFFDFEETSGEGPASTTGRSAQ